MTTTMNEFQLALTDLQVTSFGEDLVHFEPTAARCSSSSSTCCVGCIQF